MTTVIGDKPKNSALILQFWWLHVFEEHGTNKAKVGHWCQQEMLEIAECNKSQNVSVQTCPFSTLFRSRDLPSPKNSKQNLSIISLGLVPMYNSMHSFPTTIKWSQLLKEKTPNFYFWRYIKLLQVKICSRSPTPVSLKVLLVLPPPHPTLWPCSYFCQRLFLHPNSLPFSSRLTDLEKCSSPISIAHRLIH